MSVAAMLCPLPSVESSTMLKASGSSENTATTMQSPGDSDGSGGGAGGAGGGSGGDGGDGGNGGGIGFTAKPVAACAVRGDRCGQIHLGAAFQPFVPPSVIVSQLDGVDSKRQPLPQEPAGVRSKSAGQVLETGEQHTGGSSLNAVPFRVVEGGEKDRRGFRASVYKDLVGGVAELQGAEVALRENRASGEVALGRVRQMRFVVGVVSHVAECISGQRHAGV
eukprot:scaffold5667_cov68-Phaeocystis_antarctica.AAC.5